MLRAKRGLDRETLPGSALFRLGCGSRSGASWYVGTAGHCRQCHTGRHLPPGEDKVRTTQSSGTRLYGETIPTELGADGTEHTSIPGRAACIGPRYSCF
ncbi:hypothetical protein PGTUg99_022997 [Puccinia graminis f. sp. tritici]|uniref:Uncharacterized protein n=1 Tax=Puccinia graminis f. sp. tritici TaxID=56615 RepID=A0A5B0PHP6_PUCGR|nr:hypothetical protein PGTUg99_022997 [Puccinia graminis f. sp. tritici]